jgi:hypothetical protein
MRSKQEISGMAFDSQKPLYEIIITQYDNMAIFSNLAAVSANDDIGILYTEEKEYERRITTYLTNTYLVKVILIEKKLIPHIIINKTISKRPNSFAEQLELEGNNKQTQGHMR